MSLFGLIKRTKAKPDVKPILPVLRELPSALMPAEPAPVAPEPVKPLELRQLLFDAIARGDEDQLHWLCEVHRDAISQYVADWLIVPDSLQPNPSAADWYTRGISLLSKFLNQTPPQSPAIDTSIDAFSETSPATIDPTSE